MTPTRMLRRRRRPCRERQTKNWVVPVHPGAVKALKEAGAWSDDQEAYNNALFKRQAVLTGAWAEYGKSVRRRTTRRSWPAG